MKFKSLVFFINCFIFRPPLATLTNDELFKVDIQPSLELLSAKEKRKLKASKPLKCFSALQPHTKVPDPITKR